MPVTQAGVPVIQWGQVVPLTHLNTASTSTATTPQANRSAASAKDDVVMIDLDELPSPTKPVQEPVQAQGNHSNDLVRMAQHALPNLSPAFIGLLLSQGNARGNSQGNMRGDLRENARGSQDSSVPLQASAQDGDKNVESSDVTVASSSNTQSDSTRTAENIEMVKALLAANPRAQEIALGSSSRTPPVIQDETTAPDKNDTLPTPPVVQGGTISDQADNLAQQEKDNEASLPNPPFVLDGKSANQPENPGQKEMFKSSSPTPPMVKEGGNSPSLQGEGGVDTALAGGENTMKSSSPTPPNPSPLGEGRADTALVGESTANAVGETCSTDAR